MGFLFCFVFAVAFFFFWFKICAAEVGFFASGKITVGTHTRCVHCGCEGTHPSVTSAHLSPDGGLHTRGQEPGNHCLHWLQRNEAWEWTTVSIAWGPGANKLALTEWEMLLP